MLPRYLCEVGPLRSHDSHVQHREKIRTIASLLFYSSNVPANGHDDTESLSAVNRAAFSGEKSIVGEGEKDATHHSYR